MIILQYSLKGKYFSKDLDTSKKTKRLSYTLKWGRSGGISNKITSGVAYKKKNEKYLLW